MKEPAEHPQFHDSSIELAGLVDPPMYREPHNPADEAALRFWRNSESQDPREVKKRSSRQGLRKLQAERRHAATKAATAIPPEEQFFGDATFNPNNSDQPESLPPMSNAEAA